MTIDIWGDKPKSQVDPTTVDEEIAALIAAHEADPDSHLESGESLQSHKASEIIDHVVGSVLADKMSMTEIVGSTIFESLDGWSVTGSVSIDNFPGCALYVEYGVENESSLDSTPQVPQRFIDDTVDLLFQLIGRFSLSNTHYHAWLGFLSGYSDSNIFFGFQVRNGALYAHFDDTDYSYDLLITGVVLTDDNVFRIQYNAASRTISWYVNGSLVASYVVNVAAVWNSDQGPSVGLVLTQSNDGSFYIGMLNFSRQI